MSYMTKSGIYFTCRKMSITVWSCKGKCTNSLEDYLQ